MTPASGGSRENEPSMPHMQALCRASWRGVMREIVQTKALLPLNAMAANKSSEQQLHVATSSCNPLEPLVFALSSPPLPVCARSLKQALARDFLLRLEARVENALLLIALSGQPPEVADLLMTALKCQDLLYALRVIVQRQRGMHDARLAEPAMQGSRA
eukprot:CAMPEP_0115851886 /NCGR_PEP_ID=MMETSP0287-20121206/12711_1 /TAXON_ID=412157 /ORGANISM="Chrysochromulina rotalis, Strain UIO044" /LENGTH=158 /DNA_ID=CAMNT_0003305929 /DNA_START=338 /DNA_END=812 /DNA_ORIENTATION=-